jgi:hypothetical protein
MSVLSRWSALVAVVVGSTLSIGSSPAAACDELAIPSLGAGWCVVEGGQAQLDAGHAVRYTDLSTTTVNWLTGHRTSHGGTFGVLTGLRVGAIVHYRDRAYVVTDYRLVNRYEPAGVADWLYSYQHSLGLQTSASGSMVHVWRAVEVPVPPPVVEVAPPPVPPMP